PGPSDTTYIRIMLLEVRYSDERTSSVRVRGEDSQGAYAIRPRAFAYDLYYLFNVFAVTRAAQVTMLEFLLKELQPYGALLVNDVQIPIETATWPALEMLNGMRTDRVGLMWRVLVREEIGAIEPVKGVSTVIVESDFKT